MKHTLLFVIATIVFYSCVSAEYSTDLTGQELIEKSIAFYEPKGSWNDLKVTFLVEDSLPASRPSGSYSSILEIEHDPKRHTEG